MRRLSPQDEQAIRDAAGRYVRDAAVALRPTLEAGRWLAQTNPYASGGTDLIRENLRDNTVDDRALREFMAASVAIHCLEGWSFLGRAITCQMKLDAAGAVHLAYYAELRGAMALLAYHGIGVFNVRHIAYDADGRRHRFNGFTTHGFTWKALEIWAQTQAAANFIAKVLAPGGIRLDDWVREFSVSGTYEALAREWLLVWGIDLQRFGEDQDARNRVSYGLNAVEGYMTESFENSWKMIQELWQLSEPRGAQTFELLDRYLLQRILMAVHRTVTASHQEQDELSVEGSEGDSQRSAESELQDFRSDVSRLVETLNPTGAADLIDFLLKDPMPPCQILDLAGQNDPVGYPGQHLQILSRAVLLLRLATGAAVELIGDSGWTSHVLDFWWRPLGFLRGFWLPTSVPSDPADLWADVDTSLQDIGAWLEGLSSIPSSRDWILQHGSGLWDIGGCERIALWSLIA